MNDANISEDIKQERQFNIKIIITISICIYIGYIIRIPFFNIVHSVDMNDFSIVLNLALSVLGIASCLSSYNSNKKEEVFIMALMYTMFFIDILNSKETGYLLDKKQIEYYAILTSLVRVCIVYVAVSNLKKLKNFIINNKLECMIMISAISYLLLYIEYNMMTPYSKNILIFYKYYNIFLAILYTIISIRFFKKSLVKKDYIYGVIGASALIFSIKSIYDFYYTINSSKEIEIMANSTILLGFITFIIGLFIELSQTIKINRVLDEQRNLFIKIIEENKHSNIIICDENYEIQYKNKKTIQSMQEMGYIETLNIKKGSKFDLKKIFADISNINDIEEKVTKEGSYTADIYDNHTDSIVDLSITVFEINNKKYKVIIIKDISEKYKLEKVLLECEMIKQEDIMKNEFFSNISHELKTPLNIIYSANQLLDASINKDNFKDTYIKYSSCMNINCKRMLRLIDNIVDMTKLDIGFKSPNFENYDIVKTVEDMTLSVVSYAKVKGIELIFDTQIEELNIKCDIDMLERIILNLLSNSIKFSEQGGYILVEVFNNKDWVCIKIKDDGIGIPFDIQPKIFDRFVQGDKSIRRQKEGSGIGLSLVKSFVDLMEGEIYLESDGKKGTEVTVLLPNKLFIGDKCTLNQDYEVNIQRVQLELSDIYELYGNYD